jgi:hypothetical protein
LQLKKREIKIWYGKLEDAEKFPDMKFWQAQSDEKKFAAAWEMVLEAHELKGENLRESRLLKSVVSLQRRTR